MATELYYNGIRMFNTLIKRFEQEPVYDDSGTDLLYFRYTIAVSGLVYAGTASSITHPHVTADDQSEVSGDAAASHVSIRQRLGTPRKPFAMWLGSQTPGTGSQPGSGGSLILSCQPAGSDGSLNGVDLNNGPKPKKLRIVKITGNTLLQVEFEIEVCKNECADGTNATGILNNRWSMSDDIDSNFYTTRTVQGRLKCATANINPHSFRNWVLATPDFGFKVDRMTFTADSTGLNLDYTLVFKEIAFAAPPPATSWSLSHSETFGQNTGFRAHSSVNVMLKGPRNVDKTDLIALAAKIIMIKAFGSTEQPAVQSAILRECTITDFYSDTDSHVEARAMVEHIGKDAQQTIELQMRDLGKKIGHPIAGYLQQQGVDPASVNPDNMPGGTASIISNTVNVFTAALQSACSAVHDRQGVGIRPTALTIESVTLPAPTLTVVESLPEEQSDFSNDHKENIYTRYQAETKYFTSQKKVQLPYASGSTDIYSLGTCAIVTLAKPLAYRTIRVHAERVGQSPVMPKPEDFTDGGVKYTLLDTVVMPTSPNKAPDGQYLHAADIEYVFGLSRPLTAAEQYRTIHPPWLADGVRTDSGAGAVPDKTSPGLLGGPLP